VDAWGPADYKQPRRFSLTLKLAAVVLLLLFANAAGLKRRERDHNERVGASNLVTEFEKNKWFVQTSEPSVQALFSYFPFL